MTSPEARAKIVEALRLDLVGPWPGHAFAHELLPENPTRWYLTGYLIPETAPVEQRTDADATDEVESGGEGGIEDNVVPDKAAAAPGLIPSSMGLSVLIPPDTRKLEVEVSWGDYLWEDPTKEEIEPVDQGLGVKDEAPPEIYPVTTSEESGSAVQEEDGPPAVSAPLLKGYRRSPHLEIVPIALPPADGKLAKFPVPNSGGLRVAITVRPVAPDSRGRIPPGTRALCVFLVNSRPPAERAYQGNAFQARLRVTCHEGFVARPDLRGCADGVNSQDWDTDVADLQYRQIFDYVSGIGCAAEPVDLSNGDPCRSVQSCWIPSAEVEFVGHLETAALPGVELGMEALAQITDVAGARAKLGKLVEHYRTWIEARKRPGGR